jgi:hypothetical protein
MFSKSPIIVSAIGCIAWDGLVPLLRWLTTSLAPLLTELSDGQVSRSSAWTAQEQELIEKWTVQDASTLAKEQQIYRKRRARILSGKADFDLRARAQHEFELDVSDSNQRVTPPKWTARPRVRKGWNADYWKSELNQASGHQQMSVTLQSLQMSIKWERRELRLGHLLLFDHDDDHRQKKIQELEELLIASFGITEPRS